MAKTKFCPKCGARTKGAFFSSKAVTLTSLQGQVIRDTLGQPRLGIPSRKCRKCDWLGDIVLLPTAAPAVAPKITYIDDIDDNDEDYINHYYH